MAITDLTNTTWKFNDSITATSGYGQFNLSTDKNRYTDIAIGYRYNVADEDERFKASANNVVFGKNLTTSGVDEIYFQNTTDGVNFTSSIEGQTIEITGGADKTNTKLISWLEANATQVKDAVVQIKPFLKGIADAIRNKKGTTETINAQNFASEIESIESGGSSNWTEEPDYSGIIHNEVYSGKGVIYAFYRTSPTRMYCTKTNMTRGGGDVAINNANMLYIDCSSIYTVAKLCRNLNNVEVLYDGGNALGDFAIVKPTGDNWSFTLNIED